VLYGATAPTALTDNAALTYLGSLVPGLSGQFDDGAIAPLKLLPAALVPTTVAAAFRLQ
jgi:hypothetical protein